MLLTTALAFLSLTLSAESQKSVPNQQVTKNVGVTNQDQIYFFDDSSQRNVVNNVNRPAVTNGNTLKVPQNSGNERLGEKDSYLQGIVANNGQAQYNAKFDSQKLSSDSPSIDLQPPPIGGNNENYYASDRFNGRPASSATRPLQINPPGQNIHQNLPIHNNFSQAVTNFGLNLMKTTTSVQGRNVVMSPYSIATLLALLQQGAVGTTLQQISSALQMSPEFSSASFKSVSDDIQKRNSNNILKVANGLFVADAFHINPAFKNVAIRDFDSEVNVMKFSTSGDAARRINNWIASKTNNKIPELLSPNNVGDDTQMVLVNAVYFKGLWQIRFKPHSTVPREFRLTNGTPKTVPFMRMRKIFRTGHDPKTDSQIIVMPFEKEQYSLLIILPSKTSTLNNLVASLTESEILEYLNYPPLEVDLELPKFTIRSDTDLNPVFRTLGIQDIFTGMSNLAGLGTYREFSPQVSSALHSALLSINEDGGSAAAATSFAVVALSYDDPSDIFKADRPFLAILWDKQTSLPLFMAKVEDPVL